MLPIDVVVARTRKDRPRLVNFARGDKVARNEIIYDIGPATIGLFSEFLRTARTIVWNGPLGVIEDKRYAFGSLAMARLIAARSGERAFSLIGGGESRRVLEAAQGADEIDFCSTGGGAMLAFLVGERMPGLDALKRH